MCDSSFERLVVPGAEFPGIPPKSKQSEAYSAGLLPAGPKTNTASQGVKVATWANRFPGRRPNRPPLVLFFPAGVVGSCSLLPALSLSPYDTPTPLPGEANLEALRMRVTHVTRGKRQTRQGCCVQPCLTQGARTEGVCDWDLD